MEILDEEINDQEKTEQEKEKLAELETTRLTFDFLGGGFFLSALIGIYKAAYWLNMTIIMCFIVAFVCMVFRYLVDQRIKNF